LFDFQNKKILSLTLNSIQLSSFFELLHEHVFIFSQLEKMNVKTQPVKITYKQGEALIDYEKTTMLN